MEIKCQLDATDASAARKPDTQPSAPHHTDNLKTKAPNTTGSDHLYNTLELLMMGIMVPETCWASNKISDKYHLLHLVGILFPHINDDARSKPHQTISQVWHRYFYGHFITSFVRNFPTKCTAKWVGIRPDRVRTWEMLCVMCVLLGIFRQSDVASQSSSGDSTNLQLIYSYF